MLQWSSTYNTGNRFIDSEHRLLFEIANEISTQTSANPGHFKELYLELMQYTQFHFQTEELLLREIQYTNLLTHQNSHQDIIREMHEVLTSERDLNAIIRKLESLLQKWLVNHIVREDMAWRPVYQAWMNKRLGRAQ